LGRVFNTGQSLTQLILQAKLVHSASLSNYTELYFKGTVSSDLICLKMVRYHTGML
jgi:hypothetical protein